MATILANPATRTGPTSMRANRTLYYPTFYLIVGGLALLIAPRFGLMLMLSNGDYGDVFPRLAGALLIGLGVIVAQVARYRLAVLYPTLVGIRVIFCLSHIFLFAKTGDPLFIVLFVMVGGGAVATAIALRRDRQSVR